jgi:hypothetical protein
MPRKRARDLREHPADHLRHADQQAPEPHVLRAAAMERGPFGAPAELALVQDQLAVRDDPDLAAVAGAVAQDMALAADATFRSRVQAAVMRRLMTLLATPANLTSDQLALARQMIYDPVSYGTVIAYGIVTDSAINARDGVVGNVLDTEITAAVNALIARYVR